MGRVLNRFGAGAYWFCFLLSLVLVFVSTGHVFCEVPCPTVEVCFSPGGECMASIVREIESAKENIYVQALSIESVDIQKALVLAYKRGVEVKVILDRRRGVVAGKEADKLKEGGMIVRIDRVHPRAHDKTMVVDGGCVITGSYNFSEVGDKGNAENIVIIRDAKTATDFSKNWSKHWDHSKDHVLKGVQ